MDRLEVGWGARDPGETTGMPPAPAVECALVAAERSSESARWFARSKQIVQRPRAARTIFGECLLGEFGEGVRRTLEQFVPTSLGLQLLEDRRCQGVLLRLRKLGGGFERFLESPGHKCLRTSDDR